ncbi:MAG: homocysteine S-methyltransferase family protein, partial [Prevotella sp.]|nr:homocysteine S-methyltransferase family protein [Prevotella sp.]
MTADERVNEIIEKIESAYAKVSTAGIKPNALPSLRKSAAERILLLDGGMGTMVQATLPDYKGNSDLLNLQNPEAIRNIHRLYLDAGADIITANTFSSQQISMKDYGMQDKIRELNLAAVGIARTIADEYTAFNSLKPRYVVGSVGPTTKMASVEGHGTYEAIKEA